MCVIYENNSFKMNRLSVTLFSLTNILSFSILLVITSHKSLSNNSILIRTFSMISWFVVFTDLIYMSLSLYYPQSNPFGYSPSEVLVILQYALLTINSVCVYNTFINQFKNGSIIMIKTHSSVKYFILISLLLFLLIYTYTQMRISVPFLFSYVLFFYKIVLCFLVFIPILLFSYLNMNITSFVKQERQRITYFLIATVCSLLVGLTYNISILYDEKSVDISIDYILFLVVSTVNVLLLVLSIYLVQLGKETTDNEESNKENIKKESDDSNQVLEYDLDSNRSISNEYTYISIPKKSYKSIVSPKKINGNRRQEFLCVLLDDNKEYHNEEVVISTSDGKDKNENIIYQSPSQKSNLKGSHEKKEKKVNFS